MVKPPARWWLSFMSLVAVVVAAAGCVTGAEGDVDETQIQGRLTASQSFLVSFSGEGDDLTIAVGDEGEGFDMASLADPLAAENQMKTSGRGIFYIRSFMDEVAFARGETGGTLLTMRKNIRAQKTVKGAEQR